MTRTVDPGPGADTERARAVLGELTDPAGALLIGVRHHAPSLAAALPALLDAAGPEVLYVELPADLQDWLPWLAHPETRAPVALAAVPAHPEDGTQLTGPAFYPFADFSPELVALRWAARRGVPAVAADLPLGDPVWRRPRRTGGRPPGLEHAMRARLTGRDGDDLWDRLVEVGAPGSGPEALRRAALLAGWALRRDAETGGGVDPLDLRREACMRAHLATAAAGGRRAAAVIGAFHAPALTATALREPAPEPTPEPSPADTPPWTVSLIPYTYALLDERSGYPAGIRDPEWQHQVLAAAGDPERLTEALTRTAVRICAGLRAQDHPSGPADAREIVRLATDLARLRGLPAPGRGELVEAVQSTLAQGEPLGRGRAVSRALERVLVGDRTGRPAPAAPRGGLAPAVERELAALGLPGPDGGRRAGTERELRLDPRRSERDRRRDVLLRRLTVCGIPYATEGEVGAAGGAEAVTTRWQVAWTPATAAMLEAVGVRGVTAAQAAEGTLRGRHRGEREAGGPTAAQVITGLAEAAACELETLAGERLAELAAVVPASGSLPELLAALTLLDRLREPAAPTAPTVALLTDAAVRQVDGLTGSEDPADARALLELAHRADASGGLRLTDALTRLARDGSPLMSGAAHAVRVLLGQQPPHSLGERVASWVDNATTPDARTALGARLTGLLTAAGPLLETAPQALAPLLERVIHLPDRRFLERLPALRGGFDTLSPAARDRLLATVEDTLGAPVTAVSDTDATTLAHWTTADLTAREHLAVLGLLPPPHSTSPATVLPPGPDAARGGAQPAGPTGTDAPRPTGRGASPTGDGAADPAGAEAAPDTGRAAEPAARPRPTGPSAGPAPAGTAPAPHGTAPGGADDPDSAASPVGTESAPDAGGAGGPGPLGGEVFAAGSGDRSGVGRAPLTGGVDDPASPGGEVSAAGTAPGAAARPVPGQRGGPPDSAGPDPLRAGPDDLADRLIGPQDRWRLVLGRGTERLADRARPIATALDELYGTGRGEGAGGDLVGAGSGGGREAAYPGVREWAGELAALFGPGIREEVLAAAVAAGRTDAVFALDPDRARPSVELLRTVLQHAGGLPEARMAALRPLVRRLVDELTRQLATRLRPALTGAVQPRPSRRPSGGLDLSRTVRANLGTAHHGPDGQLRLVPERPVFRSRARRSADWRLILVTDVSGSMEASTIWSALTASILAGVPALSTHFLAFSTEVVDFTGQVHDPLALLLEVQIGGGTHIAAGLRHARSLVTVPSRTLVVVVSDFEEGYPLGGLLAEVRALVDSGCHLLGCASLDDSGRPRYSTGTAGRLVAAGMPIAAVSPLELARWVGDRIR
ncbi:DUF5682 family protein [Streptomyces harbinensis]|uniref:DUF5682 family protein n=1 Tax=Streptomyces harbinensis TaxID=1176198 RepID=UPI003394CA5E